MAFFHDLIFVLQGMVDEQLQGREDLGFFANILAKRITNVKDAMRASWFKAHKYGLSSEVQSVENEIMHRLSIETASLNIQNILQQPNCIKFLRTSDGIKQAFALAVGKKMLSQR